MSKLGDNLKSATETARESIAHAGEKARDASTAAKRSATAAAEKSKAVAARSVESSKQLAKKAGKASSEGIEKNPLAIVAGGIAIGAIIGMLLPKTEREKKVLGKAGKAINETARRAANAAKDAGKAKVSEVGLSSDAMRDQFRDLVTKASEAVKAAGQAAAKEARKPD
ncbi:MAG: hypothetical protein IPG54_01150 [Sphingomonadales bacterium]|jgi:ElaB/YqjD/DUF883 family membrane-anchored ribosome-binding protein|nr:hypothetical protein [Sphingomonadales bacterium]MBK9003690.1 hypothetical protein [Sphingomonadales bacterium]MBK9268864.1 hypothetical protein [Sphingomonadales bacterium]MBP6434783.1 hypothetical protein [Sphingorhabdus sp.]